MRMQRASPPAFLGTSAIRDSNIETFGVEHGVRKLYDGLWRAGRALIAATSLALEVGHHSIDNDLPRRLFEFCDFRAEETHEISVLAGIERSCALHFQVNTQYV